MENYLNNRFLVLYFFPFILGSLSVLSFQPFNFTIINFAILPLFFYLILFINRKSKSTYRKKPYKKNLFIFGTLFGFGYYLSGIHWIINSLTFDDSFKILIPFALILIPLFLSLFFSLVTVLIGPFLKMNLASIFLLSFAMSFSDYIRAKIMTGFPWNLWAYSFSWATEILQILNKIGLFAFNLIVITIFLMPAVLLIKTDIKEKFLSMSSIVLTIFLFYIYGNYSINQNEENLKIDETSSFNVKVISPNFEIEYGLSDNEIEDRLKKLIKYSEPDKNLKTLFVWPEGVLSGYSFSEISIFKKFFLKNFNKNHLIAFGVNRSNENKIGFYNSLVLVNHKLEILQEYNKQKLVPFGEFLPMEKILTKLNFKKITEGYGSFLKGKNQKNLIADTLNILPLICYEIIFTKFTQQSHADTNIIINVSEDGWFGDLIGPQQHFAKAIFRAIEHDTYLIRSANKGISAIINNKGEILKSLNSKEIGNIQLKVPLIKNKNKNKNDLIFFILLITYILFFNLYKKNNVKN